MNAHQRIVTDMPANEQRQHLSEQVRVAERAWAKAENLASELEEGRSIIMAEMKLNLVKHGHAKSMNAAEDVARASDQWKGYVRKMHDARHNANLAKADWKATERLYWQSVSEEASERQQMRLVGASR